MKNIYIVSGNKGGVGKSWVALTLVEYLHRGGKSVYIVETDDGNPDVLTPFRRHAVDGVSGTTIRMQGSEAVEQFIDAVAQSDADCIVMNAAAGDNKNLGALEVFYSNIEALECDLRILWVCNAEKDGIVALKMFLDATGADMGRITVVMNKISQQDESKFGYLTTSLKESIDAAGGNEMYFPVLPARIATQMRDGKETFAFAAEKNVTNRICAEHFLKNAFSAFERAGV